MKKRIHVRVEHAVPSRCREEFLARRSSNDALKAAAKKEGSECRARGGGWGGVGNEYRAGGGARAGGSPLGWQRKGAEWGGG